MRITIRSSAVALLAAALCAGCGTATTPLASSPTQAPAAATAGTVRSNAYLEDVHSGPSVYCASTYSSYQSSWNFCRNNNNPTQQIDCDLACGFYTQWRNNCAPGNHTLNPFVC